MPAEEKVAIELAHPLRKKDLAYLGLPEGTYNAGQTVHVSKRAAEDLIKSGIAAVDPEDREAVKAALARTVSRADEPTERERELLRLLEEARAQAPAPAEAGADVSPGEPVPGTPLAEPSVAEETAPVAAEPAAEGDEPAKAGKATRPR